LKKKKKKTLLRARGTQKVVSGERAKPESEDRILGPDFLSFFSFFGQLGFTCLLLD